MIPAISPVMPVLTKEEIKGSLGRLDGIIYTFFDWDDLLSLRIKNWGTHTLKIIPTIDIKLPQELSKSLKDVVDDLFKKVLLTSLFTPVTSPIRYERHSWNRDEFDAYLDIFPCSPFDGQELKRDRAIAHSFAIEILSWADTLPFKTSENRSQELVALHHTSPVQSLVPIPFENGVIDYTEAQRQLKVYLSIGSIAERQLVTYTLSRTLQNITAETKVAREKIEEFTKLEEERMGRRQELQRQTIDAEIASIKHSQNMTQQIMDSRLKGYEHELNLTVQNIATTGKRNKAQLDEIADLEKKIQSL